MIERDVTFFNIDETKRSPGKVRIQSWTESERRKRAFKYGGGTFVAAIVSILFPIVHFVLVPGFLLATPFVAMFFLKQGSFVVDGSGKCPECGGDFTVARSPDKFPLDDLCTICRKKVVVVLG